MQPGMKFDGEKARWDRMPWRLLSIVAGLLGGRLRQKPAVFSTLPKPARLDLVPQRAIYEISKVMGYGAGKYEPNNWRRVVGWRWRYFGALFRHTVAWWLGEKNDPETGMPHLAHAACCVMFMLENDLGVKEGQPLVDIYGLLSVVGVVQKNLEVSGVDLSHQMEQNKDGFYSVEIRVGEDRFLWVSRTALLSMADGHEVSVDDVLEAVKRNVTRSNNAF